MKKFNKEGLRSDKGFTMIELIIVIAIMGILAAILVPSFTQMTRKSRFNADLNTVKHVQTQIELYMAEHDGEFPGATYSGGTESLPTAAEGSAGSIVEVLADQQYLEADAVTTNFDLDLQSRNDGVELRFDANNKALQLNTIANSKVKSIAQKVSARDQKWVAIEGNPLVTP